MRRQLAMIALFFSLFLTIRGADFRFARIGVLQGLSSNSVSTILTDSRNFVWIGTASGLNCFDGEIFRTFTHHRNDSTSIPYDNILAIAEDKNGMLWIGTQNGIAKLNPWNGKAETIREISPAQSTNRAFNNILIDRSGILWATSLDGLWRYDEKKNVFELVLFCTGKENIPDRCTNIYEDHEGVFWICSYSGLYNYNRQTGEVKHISSISSGIELGLTTCIYEDHEGIFWIGTWAQGIVKFLPHEGKFSFYKWITNSENPSAVNILVGIQECVLGNSKYVCFASNNGLGYITDKNLLDQKHVIFIQHDPANPESISSSQVSCIHSNSFGQLWAATGEGISILLPEHQLFQSFSTQFIGQTTHIVPDKNGTNFFCTWYGNGMQQLDSNGNVLRTWKHIPENSKDVDCEQVSDALRAKNGTLWVATFGGLSCGDANGNNFKQILPDEKNPNSICSKHITCLAEDVDGNIWCGSYGKGISVLNPATYSGKNFTSNDNSSLNDNLIWSLYCTREKEIWVATNNGLNRFDVKKNKFDSWKYIIRNGDTLRLGVCGNLFEDSKGVLWIGTDNGLFYRKSDGNFGAYLKEDGLADSKVDGIREDREGNIWIITENGLSKLNPANGTFTNYSVGSGLPIPNLSGDLGNGPNGKLLIGLNSSIVEFDPLRLNISISKQPIFITNFSVSGRNFLFDKNPSSVLGTELNWNENVVSFDFVSPGFRGDPLMKYAYQLVGSDEGWINSGPRHFVEYGGLPPGNYTFTCRASIGNGLWSEPANFSFVIHSPFWKTWWFIISVTGISILLIVIIVRREATRKIREQLLVLEKQQAIEKERNRISRDMHDDLGSGLTKIAILSEVVKKKIGKENSDSSGQKQIDIISESARELVDNLNEIIWALNPENDNLSNLAAYIREYADRFLEPFGINLHATIPENLPALHLSEEKRRNLFLIIKEALHNIVKHAEAKTVNISFHSENEKIIIVVSDDGKGFEISSARPLGNGLKSMKKRAAAIQAEVEMKSEKGKGTFLKISLQI